MQQRTDLKTSLARALTLAIVVAAPREVAGAAVDSLTIAAPANGSVYHIGDVMRIGYEQTQTTQLVNDWAAISVNNGRTYADFKQIGKTASDTTAIYRHFDWVIPDSLLDLGGHVNKNIHSMVSDSCIIWIHPYVGAATSLVYGLSGRFSIGPTSIRSFPIAHGGGWTPRIMPVAVGATEVLSLDGRVRGVFSVAPQPRAAGCFVIAPVAGSGRAALEPTFAR